MRTAHPKQLRQLLGIQWIHSRINCSWDVPMTYAYMSKNASFTHVYFLFLVLTWFSSINLFRPKRDYQPFSGWNLVLRVPRSDEWLFSVIIRIMTLPKSTMKLQFYMQVYDFLRFCPWFGLVPTPWTLSYTAGSSLFTINLRVKWNGCLIYTFSCVETDYPGGLNISYSLRASVRLVCRIRGR